MTRGRLRRARWLLLWGESVLQSQIILCAFQSNAEESRGGRSGQELSEWARHNEHWCTQAVWCVALMCEAHESALTLQDAWGEGFAVLHSA